LIDRIARKIGEKRHAFAEIVRVLLDAFEPDTRHFTAVFIGKHAGAHAAHFLSRVVQSGRFAKRFPFASVLRKYSSTMAGSEENAT